MLNTLGRFVINCTFGLGRFFDHVSPLGLPQQTEDLGQTLGHYGLNPGVYLVLSTFFGPSSMRDTAGLLTDSTASFFICTLHCISIITSNAVPPIP